MDDKESKQLEQGALSHPLVFGRPIGPATIGLLETLDGWGYITAGVSFLVIGMVVFAHAWYGFMATVGGGVLSAVLGLIHDLLLVIIVLELSRTIINF